MKLFKYNLNVQISINVFVSKNKRLSDEFDVISRGKNLYAIDKAANNDGDDDNGDKNKDNLLSAA